MTPFLFAPLPPHLPAFPSRPSTKTFNSHSIFHLPPTLSLFPFGPFSISCTAHLASRSTSSFELSTLRVPPTLFLFTNLNSQLWRVRCLRHLAAFTQSRPSPRCMLLPPLAAVPLRFGHLESITDMPLRLYRRSCRPRHRQWVSLIPHRLTDMFASLSPLTPPGPICHVDRGIESACAAPLAIFVWPTQERDKFGLSMRMDASQFFFGY